MGKINMDKFDGSNPILLPRQTDVKKSETSASSSATTAAGKTTAASSEDTLKLSSRASEVGRLVDQLKDLPDTVRQQKVDFLRAQIASGDYDPTGEQIADAILKDER